MLKELALDKENWSRFQEVKQHGLHSHSHGDFSVYENNSTRNHLYYLDEERKLMWQTREQQNRMTIRANLEAPYRPSNHVTGPVKFISKLLETWNLESRDAAWLLGFEKADGSHVDDIMTGRVVLTGRDIKDRIACLFEIRRALSAWLRNDAVENEWLREPHSLLDDQSPMDLLKEGSMENLFLVREYVGVAASGHSMLQSIPTTNVQY